VQPTLRGVLGSLVLGRLPESFRPQKSLIEGIERRFLEPWEASRSTGDLPNPEKPCPVWLVRLEIAGKPLRFPQIGNDW